MFRNLRVDIRGTKIDERVIKIFKSGLFVLLGLAFFFYAFENVCHSMTIAEATIGARLYDPIHNILPPPIDLSTSIFLATYTTSIIAIVENLWGGLVRFGSLLVVYALIIWLRGFSMVAFPLEAPMQMIPLIDPLVSYLHGGSATYYSKDLFFSGHCASLFFLFLVSKTKWIKYLFFALNIFVASAILLQRVHYTIDIVGAYVIASIGYMLFLNLNKRMKKIIVE